MVRSVLTRYSHAWTNRAWQGRTDGRGMARRVAGTHRDRGWTVWAEMVGWRAAGLRTDGGRDLGQQAIRDVCMDVNMQWGKEMRQD